MPLTWGYQCGIDYSKQCIFARYFIISETIILVYLKQSLIQTLTSPSFPLKTEGFLQVATENAYKGFQSKDHVMFSSFSPYFSI